MRNRVAILVFWLMFCGAHGWGVLFGAEAASSPVGEAGFITIEPVPFSFHFGDSYSRMALRSAEARMWYCYLPADEPAADRPLFVFFNGGPGSSTSMGLMSMSTGRFTMDGNLEKGGDAFIPNPVSWTALGNLLYIDARQTGFSYGILEDDVENDETRFREFNVQNFNPFIDAGDFIRVLLRFLAAHPSLQRQPVILVGESYGGVRATTMLHILLHYHDYGHGVEMYLDRELAGEIQAHFDAVFPDFQDQIVPADVISRQFGAQILIQPTLSLGYQVEESNRLLLQPGSELDRIGQEVGTAYDPLRHGDYFDFVWDVAGRDPFFYPKPNDWTGGFLRNAAKLLRRAASLTLLTGADITAVPELYAAARQNVYRLSFDYRPIEQQAPRAVGGITALAPSISGGLASILGQEPGDLPEIFGVLQPWDWYFIPSNPNVNDAYSRYNAALLRGFDIDFFSPRFGKMFLQNLIRVRTFITDAAYDLVIYSPALPEGLARHDDIVDSVRILPHGAGGAGEPQKLVFDYIPGGLPEVSVGMTRTLWFPYFAESGHMVSLSEPEALFDRVSAWIGEWISDV